MRKIKNYFHRFFTAVLCMLVNLFSGKNAETINADEQILSSGPGEGGRSVSMMIRSAGELKRLICNAAKFKSGSYIKKSFFWLQGPGDRFRVCGRTR